MSTDTQIKLSASRAGRIVLHLTCIAHGHIKRHVAGIWREVTHVNLKAAHAH